MRDSFNKIKIILVVDYLTKSRPNYELKATPTGETCSNESTSYSNFTTDILQEEGDSFENTVGTCERM